MEADRSSGRAGLATVLSELRRQKGFTKQALAEASEVSATYIGQIESSIDPRTGKPYQPSPPKLRMLATALGRGDREEGGPIYRVLMEAAGYLPEELPAPELVAAPPPAAMPSSTSSPGSATDRVAEARGRWDARPREVAAPKPPESPMRVSSVTLADPRLEAHVRPLLEHWDELTSREQGAVLEFLEYMDEKRRRR